MSKQPAISDLAAIVKLLEARGDRVIVLDRKDEAFGSSNSDWDLQVVSGSDEFWDGSRALRQ